MLKKIYSPATNLKGYVVNIESQMVENSLMNTPVATTVCTEKHIIVKVNL